LWRRNLVERDFRFDFLPADTRLPDHTIWNHVAVVSALAGCDNEPAFLKFQIGPVQEFIAAARSTRDLWSGSYLLSWLIAAGLRELALEIGPDAVIYPNLHGQPLFDLQLRDDLWAKLTHDERAENVWKGFAHDARDLLVPNLPNVFLALVPASRGAELGRLVEKYIRDELDRVATHVWRFCTDAAPDSGLQLLDDEGALTRELRETRFFHQIERLLSVSWVVTPWPDQLDAAAAHYATKPVGLPEREAWSRVDAVRAMAEQHMPKDHRDGRFYFGGNNGSKQSLDNVGLAWSAVFAEVSAQLDAVRQTRAFAAWQSDRPDPGTANNKDALNGREEAVVGGVEWSRRCRSIGGVWRQLFRKSEWVGASTLLKRVWHVAYLEPVWGFRREDFAMPSVLDIAAHDPFADEKRDPDELGDHEKHFAALALDGDQIGQWVSGKLTPSFGEQLASYEDGSGQIQGAYSYFTSGSDPDSSGRTLAQRYTAFLATPRPLSPSYHLQFSQALSNFALRCARRIVEAHDGRLIYAGGDDVLAILPADTALACAEDLRAGFRGELPPHRASAAGIGGNGAGFLVCTGPESRGDLRSSGLLDRNGAPIPFVVPGPRAEVSVGLALAHVKAPLQDVVRAAQTAEKRAKRSIEKGGLGRGAVAVTLHKRSGEILDWGCRWHDGALQLHHALLAALREQHLSAKFPHRLSALLEPYGVSKHGPVASDNAFVSAMTAIVRREFAQALARQRGPRWPGGEAGRALEAQLLAHLESHFASFGDQDSPEIPLSRLRSLCAVVAFAHRTSFISQTAPGTRVP
jgi:hypothetical protein